MTSERSVTRHSAQKKRRVAASPDPPYGALLADYPDWEITVRVDVPGKEKSWPGMGLIIACDEIIDQLQREYFPPEFRNFTYEGGQRNGS